MKITKKELLKLVKEELEKGLTKKRGRDREHERADDFNKALIALRGGQGKDEFFGPKLYEVLMVLSDVSSEKYSEFYPLYDKVVAAVKKQLGTKIASNTEDAIIAINDAEYSDEFEMGRDIDEDDAREFLTLVANKIKNLKK